MPQTTGGDGVRIANLDDVYVAFNEIGGRDPDFPSGEHTQFVGMEYSAMREAVAHYFGKPAGPTGPVAPPPPKKAPPKIPTTILDTAGAIKDGIWQNLLDALATLGGIKDDIAAQVEQKLNDALPAIATAAGNIQKQLDGLTHGLIPSTLSLMGAALGGVETLLATFLSNTADIGDIGDYIVSLAKEHETPLGDFVFNAFGGAFAFGLEAMIGKILPSAEGEPPVVGGIIALVRQSIESQRNA